MAGFTLNGGNGPDFSKSKIMGMLNNKLDLAKNLLNNNTYKTTIEAETKGFDKAEKQVEDIKESMDELQGSIQSVQKLLKDTFGKDLKISEKAFKKYGDTLVSGSKAIKQLIDENTAAFDRSASDGKGRQQINTSYRSINSSGNLAKSLPPSLQDKYETRMNALLKSKNISEPKTVEKVAALVGQLTKVIEYQDRITGNFRKGDMDYSSVGGIYKYADTVKEIVRTHVAIADLEKQLKDLTGGSILTDKESSVRTSRSDIDIEMKSLREEMMSIMANTFAHWTPNKKGEIIPGSNRPNKFDNSMANLEKLTNNLSESLLTIQRGINASRKAPVYEEEKKEVVPGVSSKPVKNTKFDKYLNMTLERATAELAKAYKKTEDAADARSYKDFAGIYKAFLAQGGQQSKKYDELLDFIKDEHGDYLKELDEAFSGVINKRQEQKDILQRKLLERKATKSEEPKKSNETSHQQTETNVRETVNGTHVTTKTTGHSTSSESGGITIQAPGLGTAETDMTNAGNAAKQMGAAISAGSKKGQQALSELENQARKTGNAVQEVQVQTQSHKELTDAELQQTMPGTNQGGSSILQGATILDKKVAELQYLHDKIRTIFDGKDGIINEDMSYSEKFDSSEVQRMITLLSQLSDAELKATMGIEGEDWVGEFRYNLQAEINAIKELQDELQKVQDGTSTEDAAELDIRINDRLEHIYEMAQNVTRSFDSSLIPSVKEFLSLIEDNLGISSMSEFMMGNAKEIDRYINDIIHNGKSVKEVFADMENRYGWDTARFDNLIEGNVPTELKGLYNSLFSDVENRIKPAEQAAEEFNAKLREFQSNQCPISSGTTTLPDKGLWGKVFDRIVELRQYLLSGQQDKMIAGINSFDTLTPTSIHTPDFIFDEIIDKTIDPSTILSHLQEFISSYTQKFNDIKQHFLNSGIQNQDLLKDIETNFGIVEDGGAGHFIKNMDELNSQYEIFKKMIDEMAHMKFSDINNVMDLNTYVSSLDMTKVSMEELLEIWNKMNELSQGDPFNAMTIANVERVADALKSLGATYDEISRSWFKKDIIDVNETPVLTDSFRQTDEEAQIEKIKKRTEEMMNRMQNHPDMKQFGDANIITEYITAAQKDLDKSIDDLFNEFENKLNQRKQEFIDKQQKEEAQKDNRQQFISFLRGISPTGQEEYGQNLAKYSDLFNSITDDANTLDAAINKVKQDLDSVKAPKLGNGEIPVVSDMEDTLSRSNIEAIGQQLEVPLNKIIKSLAKQSGIRISEFKEKFGQTLIDIITQMKDSFSFTDSGVIKFANEVWDSFDSFVEKLGREIGAKSEKKTSIYDDFYDNYKGSKFYISDHLKSELGEADYERMVKSGRISRTKKKGYVNPDSGIFDEMMSQYPDILQDAAKTLDITLDNLTGPADKILVMVQALIDAKQELSKGFVPYDQLSPDAKNAAMEKGATLGLDMMKQVGNIYTEKYKPEQKPTSADELNKFLQDSKTIFDSFGKTQNDIPTEWNAFLNQLQNGAITADDALKELKATLEGLKKSEPPEPPKPEPPKLEPPKEPPKKQPKTPEPPKIPPIDDRILPPEKRTGEYSDVRHKIIQRIRNADESWEDRYQDKSGNVWVEGARKNKKTGGLESYRKDITQYTQLEREAIQVTNDLTDAIAAQQALERKGDTSSDLYKKTQERIDILNKRKTSLEGQADEYARNHTDPSYPYTRELFDERVKKGTELHTNAVERRSADQIIKEEERKQQAIEKTNSFLDTQSTNLESARDKHVKNRTDIPADVLDELENKYADINKMISGNKDNGNMSETTSTRIQNSIKEYQTLVDIMEKNQKIAMKLSGYSPEAAKSKLGEEIQSLIQDMQLLTQVDTSDLEGKLKGIQEGLDMSKNPTSDYIKQVNQMVNAIRFDFGKKQNEFDFQKEIEKNVADYEKAAEKVGKIQAQIDFGNGENKNQLQDQLQAAKNEADELASHLEKLRGVINQTGTDEWKEKVNKKIDSVYDKYMDEKTTSSYKDAQVASQNKQYETAKKALNDYEAALRKVAEAQAALDFGDKAKKPELEANLEAAKNKARELKESLDAVKGSLLDQDRLSAEQVTNNKQRMTTADDIFSDPKKSPYYQSKENTSNEKEKAAAIKELVEAYKLWQEWHSKYIKEYMNDEKRAQNKGIMDAAKQNYIDLHNKYVQEQRLLTGDEAYGAIKPEIDSGKNDLYNTFDNFKKAYYKQLDDLENKLKEKSPELQQQIDEIKNKLSSIFAIDQDGKYANATTRKSIDDIMDELLDLDNAFKNIKGPGAKQNAFSNNLKKFGQDIEKEMQRLGNVSPKYQEQIKGIQEQYDQINTGLMEKAQAGTLTPDDISKASQELAKLDVQFRQLLKDRKALYETTAQGSVVDDLLLNPGDIKKSKEVLRNWVETQDGVIKGDIKSNRAGTKFEWTEVLDDGQIQKVVASVNAATGAVRILKGEAASTGGVFSNTFKSMASGLAQYATYALSTHRVMSTFFSQFKQGFATLQEYDKALTTISYTMDVSKEQLSGMGEAAVSMAKDLKMSLTDTLSIYQIYANMKTSSEEIRETAMPTAILSNLSGVDASTAADQIQGVIQQFGLLEDAEASAAEQSMHVVDVFDKISSNIAMDYAKGIKTMAEAVEKTGAEAKEAGLSFEQLAALSAKVAERTRSEGSEIGGAIRTILVRLSKVGKMPGYEDEVSNEELSNASKSLHAIGVEVYDAQGNFRDFTTIVGELEEKWDSLSDAQRSNISYNVAATRQSEKFRNILVAYKEAMQLAAEATETNGNALANQEKYEQSISGRLQGIRTNWQTFWMDVADSAVVDGAISGLELLTKAVAGVGDVFGEAGEAVVAFGGFLGSAFLAGNIPKVLNAIVEFGKSDKTLFQTIAATNFGKGIADIINQFKTASTLGSAFLGTIKSIGSALLGLASDPILIGILATIAGIVALKSAFDIFNPSLDKLRSNAQVSKNAYEEIGNKIDDLNQQLQTTQSRINEINSQENISLVDQSELENLESQNEFLKTQIELEKERQKVKQQEAIDDALKVVNDVNSSGDNRIIQANSMLDYGEQRKKDIESYRKELEELSVDDFEDTLFSTAEQKYQKRKTYLVSLIENAEQDVNEGEKRALELYTELQEDGDILLDSSGNAKYNDSRIIEFSNGMKNLGKRILDYDKTDGQKQQEAIQESLSESWFSGYETSLRRAAKNSEDSVREIIKEMLKENTDSFSGLTEMGMDSASMEDTLTQYFMNLFNPGRNIQVMKDVVSDQILSGIKDLNPRTIIEEGLDSDVDWFQSLNASEIEELFNAINNQEIDTSGWGIKEAKEYLESLKEVAPEIESSFSQMFAPDKKVPTTVSEYVDTFQSEINTISTTLEKLKTGDFKDNDIVDLIQSIPELGDKTDNLEEALSQYSLDSLKSTISKIWESVEKEENGITDLQKQYIQRIINGLMQSVDLSGLGQDAFSTALANYIGDTSKSTAGYKQEIAAKLSEKYGNDEYGRQAVITILADTSLAYASYEELVDRIESQEIIIQLREDDQSIKNIDDNLTTLQHEADRLQETQDYKIEIGMELNESDYRNLIRNAESQINELQNKISLRKKDISLLDPVEDAVLIKTYQDEIASAQSTIGNLYKSIPGWNKNINALPGTRIEKHQAALSRVLDEQQRKRDLKELGGQTLTGEDWDRTIRLLESNAKLAADKTNAAYEEAYNNHTDKREAFTESELTSINDAKNAEIEAMRQVSEARQSRRQAEIKPLTDELTELQSDALQYENAITSAENKRQKVSKKLYDGLIKNGKKQVKVLNDQKKKLKEQQKAVDLTHDEWLDLQSQIDDVDSSILSMESNLAGWQDAMDGLIISNAQALSSAITQAMSEINAATGLTMETMQELNKQFSDLEGHDMSTLFYRTPEGMDVNVDRMREFTQLEYDSVNSAFERQIANLTKLRDGVSQGSDAWESYNAQLTKVKNEQAMFFAEYQQQMESMSLYSQLTIAEGTENQGARYEAVQKRFKDFKEAFDKGRVGTDEFDAFASYLNSYGVGDYRTFKKDYEKATRYIKGEGEEKVGLGNFLTDLQGLGMASEDAAHHWTISMDDMEQTAIKLGTSVGVVKDTLGMLEEYNFDFSIVGSMTEATLNASELSQELYEAKKAYIDMEHAGADQTVLDQQKERIAGVEEQIATLDDTTDRMVENNTKAKEERFRDLIDLLSDYREEYNKAVESGDETGAAQWKEDIQNAVDEFGFELTPELELTADSRSRYWQTLKGKVKEQGTIDAPMPQFDTKDKERIEAYTSSLEKVKSYYDENTDAAQGYFNILKKYSRDELESIKLHDGAYNVDMHDAEDALEALADASGLTQEQLSSLFDVLEAIGELKIKPELDLSNLISVTEQESRGISKITDWQKYAQTEKFKNFDVNADVTSMTSEQLQERLGTISTLRVLIDPDDSEVQAALDKLQEDAEIQAKIQTVIDSDSEVTDINTLLGMNDSDLEAHVKAVYTEEGDAEAIIQRIQEIKEAGADENTITVKIDEDQLNGLVSSIGEAIGKLQELQSQANKGITMPEINGFPLASNIIPEIPEQEVPVTQSPEPLQVTVEAANDVEVKQTPKPLKVSVEAANDVAVKQTPTPLSVSVEAANDVAVKQTPDPLVVNVVANPVNVSQNNAPLNVSTHVDPVDVQQNGTMDVTPTDNPIPVMAVQDGKLVLTAEQVNAKVVGEITRYLEGEGATPPEPKVIALIKEYNDLKKPDDPKVTANITKYIAANDEKPPEPETIALITDYLNNMEKEAKITSVGSIESYELSTDEKPTVELQGEAGDMSAALGQMQSTADNNPITVDVKVNQNTLNHRRAGLDGGKTETTTDANTAPAEEKLAALVVSVEGTTSKITIDADNGPAKDKADEAESYAASKKPVMHIIGDNSAARGSADSAVAYIQQLNPKLNIGANTLNISSAINQALQGPFTIRVTAAVSGLPVASGTSPAFGTARSYASGTAYSGGNWGLKHEEHGVLMGELGEEIWVDPETARWQTVGTNGAEFIDKLPKNAIVFNHKQSENLLKYGHINSRGKALANGTVTGPAHADTIGGGGTLVIGGKASAFPTQASAGAANAMSKFTDSVKRATKAADNSEKKQKDIGTVFDWVEIKMQRFAEAVQDFTDQIQDYVSFSTNLKTIGKTIKALKQQMDVDIAAAAEYGRKAVSLTDKGKGFEYKDDDGNIKHYKISQQEAKDIETGKIKIEDIPNDKKYLADAYNAYKEWFEKGKEAARTAAEAERQISEMTIQKLHTIADKYDAEIDMRSRKISIIEASRSYDESRGRVSGTALRQTSENMNKVTQKDAIKDQMRTLGAGGNVDLLNRPKISTSKLKKKGYEDAGEGTATVFSSTFSNFNKGDKTKNKVAINFTPILPDGTVMEKGEFDKYCNDVVNGVREDDLGLQIGAKFTGDDAIDQAEKTAEEIHKLQESYYVGGLSKVEAPRRYKSLSGYTDVNSDDAKTRRRQEKSVNNRLIKNERENIKTQEKKAEDLQKGLDEAVANKRIQKFSAEWYNIVDMIDGCTEEVYKSKESIAKAQQASKELRFDDLVDAEEAIQNNIDKQQGNIDLKDATGKKVGTKDYQKLIDLTGSDTKNLQEQIKEAEELRASADVGTDDWKKWNDIIIKNNKQIKENQKSTAEYNETLAQMKIEDLQAKLGKLQNSAETRQKKMDIKAARGGDDYVASAKDYKALDTNMSEQSKNIKEQIQILTEQRNTYEKGSKKWREYNQQIQQNEQTLLDNEKAQIEWRKAIVNLPLEKAAKKTEKLGRALQILQNKLEIATSAAGKTRIIKEQQSNARKTLKTAQNAKTDTIANRNKDANEYALAAAEEMGLKNVKIKNGKLVKKNATKSEQKKIDQINKNRNMLLGNQKISLDGLDKNGKAYAAADRANYANTEGIDKATENAEDAFWEFVKNTGDYAQQLAQIPIDEAAKKAEKAASNISLLGKQLDNLVGVSANKRSNLLKQQIEQVQEENRANQQAAKDAAKNLKKSVNALDQKNDPFYKSLGKNITKEQKEAIRNAVNNGEEIDFSEFAEKLTDKQIETIQKYNADLNANNDAQKLAKESKQDTIAQVRDLSQQLAQIPIDVRDKHLDDINKKEELAQARYNTVESPKSRKKYLDIRAKNAEDTQKEYLDAKQVAANYLNETKTAVLSGLEDSGLTDKQKESITKKISKGLEVDTSNIDPNSDLFAFLEEYNAALETNKTATHDADMAVEEYQGTMQEITKLRFDNIVEWYDALKGIAKAKLNLDQSQRELLRARGKSEYGTAMENNLRQQQQDIKENQKRSKQSIADIKAEFNITDEDMEKLKDVDLSKYKKGETFGGFDAEEAMNFFDRASAVQQILGLQAEIKDDEVAFIQLQDTIDNMSLLELQGQMDRLQNGAYAFDENMRLVDKDGKSLSKNFVPSADALSDAMDMMSIRGRDVTVAMGQISRNYDKQITNSKAQVSNLEEQNVILREQMKGLEIGSEKYEEKAKQIWANTDAIREEQKRQEELNNAMLHLPLDKLEKELELLQSIAQLNKSLVDLTQARGLDLSFNDYDIQIKDNNAQIEKMNQELAKTKEYWDLADASADKVYDGKSVTEWEKEWNSLSVSINNLKADNETLLDSLRNDIYFRNLERAKEAAEDFRNALSTVADLINEDMAFEDTGRLTEFGVAKASVLLRDLESNNQSIEIALARRAEIEKQYENRKNNGYSELEYLTDLRDAENQLQDAIKGTYQARQNVLGLVETQGRKELESINKLIAARKEALQKKKDYYDYDKQLKGQTKEIQLLQQQIRALENVGDAESKAQKQRLEAQLKESQDALDDTVFQHTLDLSTEGLDKVSENLQENLDQFLKDLQRDLGLQADVINNATEAVGKVGPAVEASVNKLLTDFNPKITIESTGLTADSNKTVVGNKVDVDGAFASGTWNVPRNGLYKLNEGGRQEIITLPDGSILMPLSKGSGVINANLTSKLMDIATNYPAYPNFMSAIPAGGNVTSNTTVSFDSLITINGNVDESVIPQIENIAKELMNNRNFKQNMAMFTSKQIAKDMRKGGL